MIPRRKAQFRCYSVLSVPSPFALLCIGIGIGIDIGIGITSRVSSHSINTLIGHIDMVWAFLLKFYACIHLSHTRSQTGG